jgi:hypothetical protein
MDTKDKKSPIEAATIFNNIISASVKDNPKPKKKVAPKKKLK